MDKARMLQQRQEQELDDFLRNKRYFEEQQEELFQQRNWGLRALDELGDRTHYYLKDFVSDADT